MDWIIRGMVWNKGEYYEQGRNVSDERWHRELHWILWKVSAPAVLDYPEKESGCFYWKC